MNLGLEEFAKLLKFFLGIEAVELDKEFEVELDAMLDELELRHSGIKFQRPQFKAYMMIQEQSGGLSQAHMVIKPKGEDSKCTLPTNFQEPPVALGRPLVVDYRAWPQHNRNSQG